MPVINLNVAGWCIGLDVADPVFAAAVERRYAAFLAEDDGVPRLAARVAMTAPGQDRRSGSDLELDLSQEEYPGKYRFAGPGFRAGIDLVRGSGRLDLASAIPLADLEHFLRVLVALLAFDEGGLLVHAAGLRSGEKVHLFIGQSGSGKSTVSALSPQAQTLNDDLIVLRPAGRGWRASGTPFWNTETTTREGQTASGALASIYKLVQDSQVFLEDLSRAAATAELVANCPVLNGSVAHLAPLLQRCRLLADTVPVRRLHFRKDPDFWRLIEQPDLHS